MKPVSLVELSAQVRRIGGVGGRRRGQVRRGRRGGHRGRGVEAGGRDDLLGLAGAGPEQAGDGLAGVLEVLHADVVALPGDEGDRAAVLGRGVVGPVVDELLAVDPQPHAVVADGVEGVRLGELRLHLARSSGR